MAVHINSKLATHFGQMVKKERLAKGWTLRDVADRTGIDYSHLSRIERGVRPPTEAVASALDEHAFPGRATSFLEFYLASLNWMPPGFRDWAEHEDKSRTLRAWSPSFLHGLLQTADYARAQLATASDASEEVTAVRLASRMKRQQRVLCRPEPPLCWFVVDELSLYREVGGPEVMAAQLSHLVRVAALPHVTVQVLPAAAHPAGASGFMITDDGAYAEHVFGGFTYTEGEMVTEGLKLFTTISAESYRASESLKLTERLGERWATGVSPLTATPTAETASRRPAARK